MEQYMKYSWVEKQYYNMLIIHEIKLKNPIHFQSEFQF